jgi:hypothetical protein
VHAIARYVDVAFFPSPPLRPTRHEPARDRRPSRKGRGFFGTLRSLVAVPASAPVVPELRNYPR